MPPGHNRRKDDEGYEEDISMIRRAVRSPIFERLISLLLALLMGGSAGLATHSTTDATDSAQVAANREQILALKDEVKLLREGFHQRADREEHDTDVAFERLQRRVTWLEAKLNISAPPAAAAAPAPRP